PDRDDVRLGLPPGRGVELLEDVRDDERREEPEGHEAEEARDSRRDHPEPGLPPDRLLDRQGRGARIRLPVRPPRTERGRRRGRLERDGLPRLYLFLSSPPVRSG